MPAKSVVPGAPFKTCRRCSFTGPRTDFHEPDHRNLCLVCRRAHNNARRQVYVAARKIVMVAKTCRGCGRFQDASAYLSRNEARDGLDAKCRDCLGGVRRAYWAKTRDRRNQYQRDAKYGLKPGDYEALSQGQQGVCLICSGTEPGKPLCVDHDHETGRVRGLLCGPCNQALGLFRDDPKRMRAAIRYLEV